MIDREADGAIFVDGQRAIDDAQIMADWFPDYLYGVIEAPANLPQLTVDRLRRQFGLGIPSAQLGKIRDILMIFEQEHQSNLASYFCGFPDEALEILQDDQPIEVSLQVLDEALPPRSELTLELAPDRLEGESDQAYLARVRQEREERLLAKRQGTVGGEAVKQSKVVVKTDAAPRDLHPTAVRNGGGSAVPSMSPGTYFEDGLLSWQQDALCAQTDPEAFFPEKGGSTRDAKKICADCEVTEACLEYAMENDERFGIWGGLSERERRAYKQTGIRPKKQPRKNAAGSEKVPQLRKVEPYQRQFKRIEHFVELIAGKDPGLVDAYCDTPQNMARTAHALLAEMYPDKDDAAEFARRRRLAVYFLDKKWNKLQDEFGGAGKYWDVLSADLTEVFARVAEMREAYEEAEHDVSFPDHYLRQGMAGIETLDSAHEFYAPSFTSVHVLPRPKPKEGELEEDAQLELDQKKAM